MDQTLFAELLIIFGCSIAVILLLKRMKLPPILGFIATGILIGPAGLGWIHDKSEIDILAELGVALLLFTVGLEFSLDDLLKIKKQALFGGTLQVFLTVLAGFFVGLALNWPVYRSLYFGCIVSLSSTAVVLTALQNQKRSDSIPGRVSTAVLILQDLMLIPIILLLKIFAQPDMINRSGTLITSSVFNLLLLIFLVFFVRGYIISYFLRYVSSLRSREVFVITIVFIALGMAWLTNYMELSFPLGAFLGGLMIGSTPYRHQAMSDISPFKHAFNSLFFVSIGMLVQPEYLHGSWTMIILLVIAIPLLKTVITSFIMFILSLPLKTAVTIGLFLGQIGEFSFLLAYMGVSQGIIQTEFYQLMIAVAVTGMMLTPMMIYSSATIVNILDHIPFLKKIAHKSLSPQDFPKIQKMKNHVIICGFGPFAEVLGVILKEHNIPYLVLDLNPDTVEKLNKVSQNAIFGDGTSEEVLFESNIEAARLLAITVPDYLNSRTIIHLAKKLNPKIRIITRSRFRNRIQDIYDSGADVVICEEQEAGIEMGRYALAHLGFNRSEIDIYMHAMREMLYDENELKPFLLTTKQKTKTV